MRKIKQCIGKTTGTRFKICDDCEFYKQSRVDYNVSKPVFSFAYLQNGYGLGRGQTEDKIALYDSIIERSKMTWSQIQNAPRHGLGQEIIKHEAIKPQIPSIVKEDTNLLALRYNGKKPVVGYRDKDVFYVLWIDSKYSVYSHE